MIYFNMIGKGIWILQIRNLEKMNYKNLYQ
jgi:hypothetical protein